MFGFSSAAGRSGNRDTSLRGSTFGGSGGSGGEKGEKGEATEDV
jgi:hypothetical protein